MCYTYRLFPKMLPLPVFSGVCVCVCFGVKFSFVCSISQNYTDLTCLLDIKVLTLQAKGAVPQAAY